MTQSTGAMLTNIFKDMFNKDKLNKILEKTAKDQKEREQWENMSGADQMNIVRAAEMEEEEILLQYLELEYLATIEDSMDCAGICRSPLFYFSKSVFSGYPKHSCMT